MGQSHRRERSRARGAAASCSAAPVAVRSSPAGVTVRVPSGILALTADIWHNEHTGQPTARSLTADDH